MIQNLSLEDDGSFNTVDDSSDIDDDTDNVFFLLIFNLVQVRAANLVK